MSVEQNRETPLEREKQELFDKATRELAESMKATQLGETEEELSGSARVLLNARWKTARTHYRGVLDSRSVPFRSNYEHFGWFDSEEYVNDLNGSQKTNATRVGELWNELTSYFQSGTFYGGAPDKQSEMSPETAKELVKLLARDQKYR
jgi:hypothetical protein